MEELGSRFGAKLRLSEKERGGINIARKDVDGALLGLQYILIAEVLTSKEVNGEVFIDCFMSLWRGREGVSIRDIGENRFLARFAGQRDLQRVLDADQPWNFKNDLVMVADRTGNGLSRSASLSLGAFWVQMHNVPVLSMTQAVAESIGGLMGTVWKVDKSGSRDCIGRFLRVKINFNVREPLMRGTFVNFPDDGRVWVDFKYEALPKYCLNCGLLGHATRNCKESQTYARGDDENSGEKKEDFAFYGLDATTDLRGNPLSSGGRNRASMGSNGERKSSDRWRGERSEEFDGGKRSGRSSAASGMGSRTLYEDSKSLSGSGCTTKADFEETDTATSPVKPRWSSSKNAKGHSKLDDKIRNQKEQAEADRKSREEAFDAGLIGPGGVLADGCEHIVLHEIPGQDIWGIVPGTIAGIDQAFDLNVEPDVDGNVASSVLEKDVDTIDNLNNFYITLKIPSIWW